jgi:CDGSH-type Zn-finger protein
MSEKPTIELRPNGPLLIKNLEVLENSNGERLATENVIALCRCGGSGNKPYCDATHKKIGFSDESFAQQSAEVGTQSAVEGVEGRDPAITVCRNGPYEVVGAIELAGQLSAGAHYYLCRCGGSKNKPFCDGTHSKIGFEDDKN